MILKFKGGMMREKNFNVIFIVSILTVLFTLGGCGSPYRGENNMPAEPSGKSKYKGPNPKTVEECDKFIKNKKQHIKDLEGFIADQTRVNVIYTKKDQDARGWMKGNGNEDGDTASQALDQIVATEKEIIQIKEDIASVKKKRKELSKESEGCFLPSAMVQLEDGTLKPFIEVFPGDMVMSYDIGYQKLVSRPVVKRYTVEGNHLYTINEEIQTTSTERLLSDDGWKEVSMIKVGDLVHVNGKMVEVKSISYARSENTLHNMQIEDTHNFYVVSENGKKYLVHNTGGGGGGGGGSK